MKILFLLLSCLPFAALAQPALPKMDRQYIWIQPNPTNVGGYQLTSGTNVVNISGVSNTTGVIRLQEGVNTVIVKAVGTNGEFSAAGATNITRMVTLELQESINGGTNWVGLSNYSYAISNYKTSAMYRVKMLGIKP